MMFFHKIPDEVFLKIASIEHEIPLENLGIERSEEHGVLVGEKSLNIISKPQLYPMLMQFNYYRGSSKFKIRNLNTTEEFPQKIVEISEILKPYFC